jgi:hypothetical protein
MWEFNSKEVWMEPMEEPLQHPKYADPIQDICGFMFNIKIHFVSSFGSIFDSQFLYGI